VKKTKLNSTQHSFVKKILIDIFEGKETKNFHHASLCLLVESAFLSFMDTQQSGELFLHLPDLMIEDVVDRLSLADALNPNKLYVCTIDSTKRRRIIFNEAGNLPKDHPLSRELLVIAFGKPVCALICALEEKDELIPTETASLWKGLINFQPDLIASTIAYAREALQAEFGMSRAVEWLSTTEHILNSEKDISNESQIWGRFLSDFAAMSDRYFSTKEGELKSVRFLSRIQEAVGWELDPNSLFNAIASVLKDSIGYDFLELVVIESTVEGLKTDSVMKRNEIDSNDNSLSLTIKPEKLHEILTHNKPLIINSKKAADQYFIHSHTDSFKPLQSGILVPLVHSGKANGLLNIFSCNVHNYSNDILNQMESIGQIMARSVSNLMEHTSLRRMATVDGLTNIFNRRFFTEHINKEYQRARRYKANLSLIMIDIDYFKHYNDTNGHLAGDKVLANVADILKKSVREADLVARYGGEEFVVILPETDLSNGKFVAEKIRQAIEQTHFKNQAAQPGRNLTISLGFATVNEKITSAEELINLADKALYRAKEAGRNRCEIADQK